MWKDIIGYEGYYQISDTGDVRTLERLIKRSDGIIQRRRARKTRTFLNRDGYVCTKLNRNGKSNILLIHRLVAKAFIEKYFDDAEINHKDYDRTNNCVNNLELVTHRENVQYSANAGRYKNKVGKQNPNYGNHTLRDRYKNEPELRKRQSRPGIQNGRCIPVKMVYGNETKTYAYLSQCACELIALGVTNSVDIGWIATKIRRAAEDKTPIYGRMFYI